MDTTIDTGARVALWRCYLLDTRCELMRLLREPMYVIPTLLFPALFYAMFGLLLGARGSAEAARYLLATYGVFGVMGAALFGFGVTVAMDRDQGLLAQALTHRSAGAPHNERLEFLGDALLGLIAGEALYQRFPRADEGALTRARAELVRESTLARIARRLDVGPRLMLGPGEMKSGGHRRDSILSDALEAVIAAIYLDAGFDACRSAVLAWLAPELEGFEINRVGKDAKTRLQEWLQARQQPLPHYELLGESGEEHAKIFLVRCSLAEAGLAAEGQGSSRRAAEQQAAEAVIGMIERAA